MSKSQSEETGGTVVDTDPRNNFLALKLALAIKTGDGDQFCEAYDNRGLSGLNKQEVYFFEHAFIYLKIDII